MKEQKVKIDPTIRKTLHLSRADARAIEARIEAEQYNHNKLYELYHKNRALREMKIKLLDPTDRVSDSINKIDEEYQEMDHKRDFIETKTKQFEPAGKIRERLDTLEGEIDREMQEIQHSLKIGSGQSKKIDNQTPDEPPPPYHEKD